MIPHFLLLKGLRSGHLSFSVVLELQHFLTLRAPKMLKCQHHSSMQLLLKSGNLPFFYLSLIFFFKAVLTNVSLIYFLQLSFNSRFLDSIFIYICCLISYKKFLTFSCVLLVLDIKLFKINNLINYTFWIIQISWSFPESIAVVY